MLHYFFINNLIHDLETLDCLLLGDTHISLLQRNRAKAMNEKKCNTQLCMCEEDKQALLFYCRYVNA